LSVVLTFPW